MTQSLVEEAYNEGYLDKPLISFKTSTVYAILTTEILEIGMLRDDREPGLPDNALQHLPPGKQVDSFTQLL